MEHPPFTKKKTNQLQLQNQLQNQIQLQIDIIRWIISLTKTITITMIRWRREREEKLSWAEATSRLLTNCRNCPLSLLREHSRFVCHYQLFFSFPCASQSNGRGCRRSTTSLQWSDPEHNCPSNFHPGLGPWAEVMNAFSLFLFLVLNLTWWWTFPHCCISWSLQGWIWLRWTVPLSAHSRLLDQPVTTLSSSSSSSNIIYAKGG